MIALLGKRDLPTDGVEDYCTFLGQALARQGVRLEIVRIQWFERGWLRALLDLWRKSESWGESWVLLQYTALAWSQRGFSFGAVAAIKILRARGVRTAVIFHEPVSQGGSRWIDKCRSACQDWVIRALYKGATKAVFADPLATISWLPADAPKAEFVAIGANIPEPQAESVIVETRNGKPKTVVVFCLCDLPNRTREICDIVHAMRIVHEHGVSARVVFLGRGTEDAKTEIERAFASSPIEVVNLGLQDAERVSRILSESDAMLCVRGPLYPRRGSAIAGIACGLPIVGYEGAAAGTPLEEAGVQLVPYGNREMLGHALANVLEDEKVWLNLHEKSVYAYRSEFSWEKIAAKMQQSLMQVADTET